MEAVEIFEKERATCYNQFVEVWIPNYSYFLDCLPKLLSGANTKDLLVVGCGTGNEIDRFSKSSDNWMITGIDPSPEMITQARERFHEYQNIKLIEGVASQLDINNKFGAATLLLVLHFLEDNGQKLELLRSIANRLKSGAEFIILDITGDKNQIRQNLKVLELLLPKGVDRVEIESRLNRIENKLHTVSEQRMSELLQEAGFESPLRFFQSSIYMGWLTKKK